jgi:hypothetical protein
MIRYLASARRIAIFIVALLLSAQLAPTAALACEGAAEEQKITLKPVEWGKEGEAKKEKCPEKEEAAEKLVHFTVVGQWCEYEVKNENAKEKVTLETVALEPNTPKECEFAGPKFCLTQEKPGAGKWCAVGVTLTPKVAGEEKCSTRLLYINKPGKIERMKWIVETKSENGAVTKLVAKQSAE